MKRSSYFILSSLVLATSAVSLISAADLKESPSGRHSGRSAPSPKGKKAVKAVKPASPVAKGTKKKEENTPANTEKMSEKKETMKTAAAETKTQKILPEINVSDDDVKQAMKFYGDKKAHFPEKITQEGHFGVSNKTVTIENINEEPKLKNLEGHSLSVIFTKPDGDCCFYAMGRTRAEVTNALKDLITENQTKYATAKKSKKKLDSSMENYEAFLVALQKECSGADEDEKAFQKAKAKESKKSSKKKTEEKQEKSEVKNPLEDWGLTDSEEKMHEIIETLFGEKSNGTWMPAGLLPAISEKLDLRLVIWHVTTETQIVDAKKKKTVKEFVSVIQAIGAEPNDMSARHILFLKEKKGKDARAAHFVILAPLDTSKFIPTKKFEPKKK